jgi:thiol-disulfide isomerase/thioredoxin
MRGGTGARRTLFWAVLTLVLGATSGCKTEPDKPLGTATQEPPAAASAKVTIETPGNGSVASVVLTVQAREAARHRKVVVYVGAPWCEPCQRFHKAVAEGKLDATFPNLTLLEFNLDEDRERLAAAGYTSEFIPLFVRPGKDGTASSARFAGSVKGDGAVANITPKLRALIEDGAN